MMIEVPVIDVAPGDVSALVASFLKLMADPTRRRIFLELMKGETCNCEMAGLLGLPQNLISHHLRQLRQAGLLRTRRDEVDQRWIYYTIDREALQAVHQQLGLVFDPEASGSANRNVDRPRGAATNTALASSGVRPYIGLFKALWARVRPTHGRQFAGFWEAQDRCFAPRTA